MKNKICMITGATSGIGEVTARVLAQQGATVIIVSRNLLRCKATAERIKQMTANPAVDYLVADLSSQDEIRRLALDYQERYHRLNVLVNNAGAFFFRRQESVDGIEMTFALNHLNYFLLTNLLLDRLKASAPARIINVSSNAHYGSSLDFGDLQMKKRYWGMRAYGRSKFANILFTYELARLLESSGVTANAAHPGFVRTNIGKNNGWLARTFLPLVQYNALSPEEGAQTNLFLATSPDVEGISGKYFAREKEALSDPETYNEIAARQLWEISKEMTEL